MKTVPAGRRRRLLFALLAMLSGVAVAIPAAPAAAVVATAHVFPLGDAVFRGSTGDTVLNRHIVGLARTPDGGGYWLVGGDGGVFAYGNAPFRGSTGGYQLNQPIVGMAATPTGRGYWLVARDGAIFGFPDAGFFGSTGGIQLNQPVVGMVATPSGQGYWLVAADGGVFAFGDARFYGSAGGLTLASPIVGMAATPTGDGYWLLARDGTVRSYGAAADLGSANIPGATFAGIASHPTGSGYWLAAVDGQIVNRGGAADFGDATSIPSPVVGIVATSTGDGLLLAGAANGPPPPPPPPPPPGGGISGVVTDDTGAVASGVCVDAADAAGADPSQYGLITGYGRVTGTVTSVTGFYRVGGLPDSSYILRLRDCQGDRYVQEFLHDTPFAIRADSVLVAGGQTTAGINASLLRTGTVDGVVRGPDGQPLTDACVQLRRMPDGERIFAGSARSTITGYYRTKRLPPGSYIAEFDDCGRGNAVGEFFDDQPSAALANTVQVPPGGTSRADAQLAEAAAITGVVRDQAGPRSFMCVSASNADGNAAGTGSTTSSTGFYRVGGLRAGSYGLRFGPCNSTYGEDIAPEYYENSPDLARSTPVVVVAGQTRTGIDATLEPGGVITGVVRSTSGPLPGVCVSGADETGESSRGTRTSSTGYYRLAGLPAINVKVRASACEGDLDQSPEWFDDQRSRATAVPVAVPATGARTGVDFTLDTGGRVTGVVTDQHGNPLPAVCMGTFLDGDPDANGGSFTSSTGYYVIRGVQPGANRVEFRECSGDRGYAAEWSNNKPTRETADTVTVVAATTTIVNASMGPFPPAVPATAPGAPRDVLAAAGDGSAMVDWAAPLTDGGSAITGYTVTASPGGRTATAPAGTTRATMTGLTNGTAYSFTVQATNAAGTGPPSPASAAVTPRAPERSATIGQGDPLVAEQDQPVKLEGCCYAPDSKVDIVVNSTPRLLATVPTDGAGKFSVVLLLPADLGLGHHTLTATGPGAGGGTLTLTTAVTIVVDAAGRGYRFVASDGGVLSFGDYGFKGSAGSMRLNRPIVGMATTPTKQGYWLVASDGGIFAFGDAAFHGSTGGIRLNQPIVGMATSPSGRGYWLVARDGGIFAFGDAVFHGSTGAMTLNQPIVGMAASPTGGYWLVARDGGIFAFGGAAFAGSAGGIRLNQPVVGMAASPTGGGYWLVASDGGIFAYGDARHHGSATAAPLAKPIAGMLATLTGRGYYLVAADGGIFAFGDAPFLGSAGGLGLVQPIVGLSG